MKRHSTKPIPQPQNGTQAIERAFAVLRSFTDTHRVWGLADLSRELELTKPTTLRLLGVLEREGMQVIEAADGLDAVDALGQHRFDLIILDMDMPRLDGLGVLEELGSSVSTAQIPVIVLTARSDDTEARALDLGAQDYLTKPVRPTALTARVRAVLRRVKA